MISIKLEPTKNYIFIFQNNSLQRRITQKYLGKDIFIDFPYCYISGYGKNFHGSIYEICLNTRDDIKIIYENDKTNECLPNFEFISKDDDKLHFLLHGYNTETDEKISKNIFIPRKTLQDV